MTVDQERHSDPGPSTDESPPPGGDPPLLTITQRAALILALAGAAAFVTAEVYLGPARIAAAVVAAVTVFIASVRVLQKIIR